MGLSFERILVRENGITPLDAVLKKSAAKLGYTPSEPQKGVPIRVRQGQDSEWFELSSPLLDAVSETAEPLMHAVSEAFRAPVLSIFCMDSDFAVCRVIDVPNGAETTACINEPYDEIALGEPDYAVFAAAMKKKWKIKPAALKAVFEESYTFAEDGLAALSSLLHLSPAVPDASADGMEGTWWFIRNEEFDAAPFPRTLAEKLTAFIENGYGQALEAAGFRRYQNSPVRWHRIVGEPGNEVLLSLVFSLYHGYELAPFYGAQSLYCPLTLTDRYYPLHDAYAFWREAKFVYFWKYGRSPLYETIDGVDHVHAFNDPEQLRPFVEDLILPELAAITDLKTCRAAHLAEETQKGGHINLPLRFTEAVLDGDEAAAADAYAALCQTKGSDFAYFGVWERTPLDNLLQAYSTGGLGGVKAHLKAVYDGNRKKLHRAGIL